MRLWRLGSVEEMITDTRESLQLTQGLKHEPSVPVINTQAHQGSSHLNIQAIPYAIHTKQTLINTKVTVLKALGEITDADGH